MAGRKGKEGEGSVVAEEGEASDVELGSLKVEVRALLQDREDFARRIDALEAAVKRSLAVEVEEAAHTRVLEAEEAAHRRALEVEEAAHRRSLDVEEAAAKRLAEAEARGGGGGGGAGWMADLMKGVAILCLPMIAVSIPYFLSIIADHLKVLPKVSEDFSETKKKVKKSMKALGDIWNEEEIEGR